MARPLKEGLDYFPLDTNFDEKIQAIESVFKNDGLVWIIKFWQAAYRTNNGEVSLDGYQGIIHAENSRITLEKQKEILKLCVEIGLLIKTNNKKYTSNGIKKRLGHIIEERKRWRVEHKLSVIQADNPRDNQQETPESKVKESKVKESNIPPTIQEVADYCQERNNGIDPNRWFNHYQAKGWMIGKNKMKDWKAAVRTWEVEDKPKLMNTL
jgi:hypothetical protein